VENRRIVLSIAERLKDYDEAATEEFINSHPRLEDVVAADVAAAAAGEVPEGEVNDEIAEIMAEEAAATSDPEPTTATDETTEEAATEEAAPEAAAEVAEKVVEEVVEEVVEPVVEEVVEEKAAADDATEAVEEEDKDK
jgi:hypothetical protein